MVPASGLAYVQLYTPHAALPHEQERADAPQGLGRHAVDPPKGQSKRTQISPEAQSVAVPQGPATSVCTGETSSAGEPSAGDPASASLAGKPQGSPAPESVAADPPPCAEASASPPRSGPSPPSAPAPLDPAFAPHPTKTHDRAIATQIHTVFRDPTAPHPVAKPRPAPG